MSEDERLEHNNIIKEIKKLAAEIELSDAVRAFLYSLSSGDNRYRTILSSVIWGRSLSMHDIKQEGERAKRYCYCETCSLKLLPDSDICVVPTESFNKYRVKPGIFDMNDAGYVLVDLREFAALPKVDYCEKDINILNRIFGIVKELGSANKAVALQKLLTAERVMKATKNQINVVLGVLSVCGVFDTPEHKSVASGFVPNNERDFESEADIFYPLNKWRGKYGVNYDAVKKIFGPVVGGALDKEMAILGEVVRHKPEKEKKSKAEQHFEEGKYFIELSNEQRYYYGLKNMEDSWEKITKYSVTYNIYKRSEIYFDGDIIKKMIYEEKGIYENKDADKKSSYIEKYYCEIDMDVKTDNRELVYPLTSRGRKQKLTPTHLMTPTYKQGHLMVSIADSPNNSGVGVFNSRNDQYLPVPIGDISSNEDFQEYTKNYIKDLPEDYDDLISDFQNKKRVTVKIHAGDIFRIQVTPRTYTYCLVLGKVREMLKWEEVKKEHPLHDCMAQPIMYRQYDILTENKCLTDRELKNIPLLPMNIAQDNEVLWSTYPIVAHKELEESDIDLGYSVGKNRLVIGFGICDGDDFNEHRDTLEKFIKSGGYGTSLYIAYKPHTKWHYEREQQILEEIIDILGLSRENYLDEFAVKYGGITRREFIELATGKV